MNHHYSITLLSKNYVSLIFGILGSSLSSHYGESVLGSLFRTGLIVCFRGLLRLSWRPVRGTVSLSCRRERRGRNCHCRSTTTGLLKMECLIVISPLSSSSSLLLLSGVFKFRIRNYNLVINNFYLQYIDTRMNTYIIRNIKEQSII